MHLDIKQEDVGNLPKDKRSGLVIKNYTILGFLPQEKNKTKIYVFQCKICSQDPYLYGLGIFTATYPILNKLSPCGCGSFHCPEEVQFKKVKRMCENSGFVFKGFSENFRGTGTRCVIECEVHGKIRDYPIKEIIAYGMPKCEKCGLNKRSKNFASKDEEWINKFMSSGKFHEDTVFYRSDRKDKPGQQYWFMLCGECMVVGECYTAKLMLGYRYCDCSNSRQKQAYINLVYDANHIPVALKFGIANTSAYRIASQNIKNKMFSRQYEVYQFDTKEACKLAEKEVKSSVTTGLLSKEEFSDGYTETTAIEYLIDIQKIYKKHGGVSIMYIANETFSDGCIAFVEKTLFGIDLNGEDSPYFNTKNII